VITNVSYVARVTRVKADRLIESATYPSFDAATYTRHTGGKCEARAGGLLNLREGTKWSVRDTQKVTQPFD
jgi:hypothetical protein